MSRDSIAVRDPHELLTEIANTLAEASSVRAVVWICEGADDADAIRYHEPSAQVFVAGNRDAVLRCAAELKVYGARTEKRWRITASLSWCLVDRDYHDCTGLPERAVVTEYCSLEADLLNAAYANPVSHLILGVSDDDAKEIARSAVAAAAQLGRLRQRSHVDGLCLRLNRFPLDRTLEAGQLDWDKVERVLAERHPDDPGRVARGVACREGDTESRELELVNGHDLIGALQSLANAHPLAREGLSTQAVFRALVVNASGDQLAWLQVPGGG